jgi:stringent starvation protein B
MEKNKQLNKGEVIQLLLDTEGRIMLCLDATYNGVDVPSRFKNDTNLMLILNSKMPHPIHIGESSIQSELRFGGIPHYCLIPYDAIWSAFNPDTNHGMMWQDSMPNDVLKQHGLSPLTELVLPQLPPQKKKAKKAKKTKKAKKASPFKVIEGGDSQKPIKKGTKKPKLKLVD